jgi:hypothetical protein
VTVEYWDWSKYDEHHAVFRPSLMSAQTLQAETLKFLLMEVYFEAFFKARPVHCGY